MQCRYHPLAHSSPPSGETENFSDWVRGMRPSKGADRYSIAKGLDDDGDTLAAADAGCGKTVAQAFAAQFIQHGDDEARAGSAERMSERDGAAVHVGFVAIQPQLF